MKYLTKENFVKEFERIIADDNYDEVWVGIAMPELIETEYIVNPRVNFDAKLLYYIKAYDDDMRLKTYDKIEIIDIFGIQ